MCSYIKLGSGNVICRSNVWESWVCLRGRAEKEGERESEREREIHDSERTSVILSQPGMVLLLPEFVFSLPSSPFIT